MTTVMVVGGYGAVGRSLCEELSREPGIDVVVAGRRLDAARTLADQLGVSARRIDLLDPATWPEASVGLDAVVMCMDQRDTRLVAFLFERGIHYIDITAGDDFFQKLEGMGTPGVSALLSVGLAPGLTNIMAAYCAGRLERAEEIEIGLMGGLGDTHGTAGIEWLADQLFDPFKKTRSTLIDFGQDWGVREAQAVDFSDQHTLMRTLPIRRATTSVCLDSRLATRLLFGFSRLFKGNRLARRFIASAVQHLRAGSRVCNVSVAVTGKRDGAPATEHLRFFAQSESLTTGRLAAVMVCLFLKNRPPSGIWHSHQIFDVEQIFADVDAHGIGKIAGRSRVGG